MSPKRRNDEDDDLEDDGPVGRTPSRDDDDDDEDDDEDDAISLDEAEDEEDDDDDVDDDDDDDDEEDGNSVEVMERRKAFQHEAEEILEHLSMDDVKEVLKENELEATLAPKLKKQLVAVINEGEVESIDEAWTEALERLED